MTTSTPHSMTWLEVITMVVIAAILIAMLMAQGKSGGTGSFELRMTLDKPDGDKNSIRFAKVVQKRLAPRKIDLADLAELTWWSADEVEYPFTMTVMYDTYSRFNAFSERMWVVSPDGLLVEYSNGQNSPRYRLISFARQRGQKIVEVTIPREPPSEAEAWRPCGTVPMPDA